jgi:hypothetical protein
MNWPYQLPPPKETFGIVLALVALVILILFCGPRFFNLDPNFGFDASWMCLYTPQSEPICLKDRSK